MVGKRFSGLSFVLATLWKKKDHFHQLFLRLVSCLQKDREEKIGAVPKRAAIDRNRSEHQSHLALR